jgi:hypothetical protein
VKTDHYYSSPSAAIRLRWGLSFARSRPVRWSDNIRGAFCHDILDVSARVVVTVVALPLATSHPGIPAQRFLRKTCFSQSDSN